MRQKRPTNTSIPEVCARVKSDLLIGTKRPVEISIPELSLGAVHRPHHSLAGFHNRQTLPHSMLLSHCARAAPG